MGDAGEVRVEELAERAGVSVDTVRYYQAKGLLAPPRRQGRLAWYGPAHLQRIARIRELQGKGLTLAAVARVLAGELDAADEELVGAVTGELHPARLLSLQQMAERTGIPEPLLQAVVGEGLLVPRRVGDEEGFNEDDVAAAAAGLALLQWGIPLSELLDLGRRHHRAVEDLARRAVELFDTHVRQPQRRLPLPGAGRPGAGGEADDAGGPGAQGTTQSGGGADTERLVAAFHSLLPAATTLVTHHFTRVLLQTALDHIERIGTSDERAAVRAEASR